MCADSKCIPPVLRAGMSLVRKIFILSLIAACPVLLAGGRKYGRAQLQADESLAAEQRKDLLTDVESLRSQLAKSAINPIILQTLLQPLTEIDALGELVSDMNVLLEELS